MINFKQNILLFLAVVFLVLTSVNVLADSQDYDIVNIKVNDLVLGDAGANTSKTLDIERTDSIDVEVEFKAFNFTPDVRIQAEIDGYEFGDIKDRSDIFDAEAGVTYRKVLHLDIPEDLQSSRTYTLRIEASDPKNNKVKEVRLNLDEKRHFLRVFDVILRPQGSVEAGKPVFATVRVENLGEKKERDIEVRVSIPQLGVIAREYMDELVSELEERVTLKEDQTSSKSTNELLLRVPEDAKTGNYDLLVEVIYNRGHSKVVQKIPFNVVGVSKQTPETTKATETTIVSVDGTSKTVQAGEETVYKIMFANLDNVQRVYTVEVAGTQLFADSRVDPGFITVQAGKTGEVYAYLKVKDNAESRKQFFTLRAMSGNEVIKEVSLTADVKGKEATSWVWLRNLIIGIFVVLVVVLIVLLITWGVRGSRDESREEVRSNEGKPLEPSPSVAEGQSYYYYPKQ